MTVRTQWDDDYMIDRKAIPDFLDLVARLIAHDHLAAGGNDATSIDFQHQQEIPAS